jgi:hypothetical protein
VFFHPVVSPGHIVHSGASVVCNVDALYFMLGGTGAVSIKSALGQVTSKLYFCIRWHMWVAYCIPVHPGCATSMHYFSCSCGTVTDSTESAPGHITRNSCSGFDGICGTCSALRWVRGAKHRCNIFLARGGTGMDSTKWVPGHITPNLCF